jgi:hypothetical protein
MQSAVSIQSWHPMFLCLSPSSGGWCDECCVCMLYSYIEISVPAQAMQGTVCYKFRWKDYSPHNFYWDRISLLCPLFLIQSGLSQKTVHMLTQLITSTLDDGDRDSLWNVTELYTNKADSLRRLKYLLLPWRLQILHWPNFVNICRNQNALS